MTKVYSILVGAILLSISSSSFAAKEVPSCHGSQLNLGDLCYDEFTQAYYRKQSKNSNRPLRRLSLKELREAGFSAVGADPIKQKYRSCAEGDLSIGEICYDKSSSAHLIVKSNAPGKFKGDVVDELTLAQAYHWTCGATEDNAVISSTACEDRAKLRLEAAGCTYKKPNCVMPAESDEWVCETQLKDCMLNFNDNKCGTGYVASSDKSFCREAGKGPK